MDAPGRHGYPLPMAHIDEFTVVERCFSSNPEFLSVGLANIHADVPDVEANKDRIERACRIFRERGVDVAIFPEFCLSGYFWDDHDACRRHLERATTERHLDWIEDRLRPLLDDEFRGIVLNNLTHGGDSDLYYNTTFLVTRALPDPLDPRLSYHKVFLPGIEKRYTLTGGDDRLDLDGAMGRVGFTTCYDYLFSELLRRYSFEDGVDAIVQVASWRAVASREYPRMNVSTDMYYGDLWDVMMAASSAQNQVWTIACNAVGTHGLTGTAFWGGSGIWAPSGLRLVQASHIHEELLVVHNLDLRGGRQFELDDFNYEFDFRQVHRSVSDLPAVEESVD